MSICEEIKGKRRKIVTLYLSGMFASKSIKIIPSAVFFPEGMGYLEIFLTSGGVLSRNISFIYNKQTVSKTAVHILMCIAECSAWIHSLIK